MSKLKKGKWRRPQENEGRDKPEIATSGLVQGRPKSRSAFLVALYLEERKIMLVHKYDELPSWGCAGGGVEPGETPEEGLYREVRDESGHLLNSVLGERSGKFLGLGTAELVAVYDVNPWHQKYIFVDIVTPIKNPVIKEVEEIDKVRGFELLEIMDKSYVPYDESARDGYGEMYVKESHREYILVALRFLGCLEAFGFKEATIEDYLEGELPEEEAENTEPTNEVSAPATN